MELNSKIFFHWDTTPIIITIAVALVMASVIYFLVRTVYINGIAMEFFNFLMAIFAVLFWIYLTIMIPLYIQTEDKALVIHRIVTSVEIPYESLHNLTPADVYFGRGEQILELRVTIKQNSIGNRGQDDHNFTKLQN